MTYRDSLFSRFSSDVMITAPARREERKTKWYHVLHIFTARYAQRRKQTGTPRNIAATRSKRVPARVAERCQAFAAPYNYFCRDAQPRHAQANQRQQEAVRREQTEYSRRALRGSRRRYDAPVTKTAMAPARSVLMHLSAAAPRCAQDDAMRGASARRRQRDGDARR